MVSLKKAIDLEPEQSDYYLLYGTMLKRVGKIEEAIERQLIDTKLPIAAHLTGGLDSTGICAILQKHNQKSDSPMLTYCCGISDEQLNNPYNIKDERELLREISDNTDVSYPKMISSDNWK